MKSDSRFDHLGLLIVSVLLVLAGHFFVIQREPSAAPGTYRNMSYDALQYISMIEDDFSSTVVPYRNRILVPALAKLIPLPAPDALRLITYTSLFVTYYAVLLIGLKIGLNQWGSLAGLLLIFTSNVHVYNYNNPFLLDAFQQMALTWMLRSLLFGSLTLYVIAATLGVLCREAPLVMVPTWAILKHWRQGLVACGLLAGIFLVPKLILPGNGATSLIDSFAGPFLYVAASRSPLLIPVQVFWAWGFIWFPAFIGLWLLPRERFVDFAVWLVFLLAVALLSMLFAYDTVREVAVLSPLFAITIGQMCTTLLNTKHSRWVWFLVVLSVIQLFVALPNVVFGVEVWHMVRWGKVGLLLAGTAYSVGVLFILRKELKAAYHTRMAELTSFMRARFRTQRMQ